MSKERTIGAYIYTKRTHSKLTQEQLAVSLQSYSKEFENVDSVTISRWERSKTSPSLRRQVEIVSFFKDAHHIVFSRIADNQSAKRREPKKIEAIKHTIKVDFSPYMDPNDITYRKVVCQKYLNETTLVLVIKNHQGFSGNALEEPSRLNKDILLGPTSLALFFYAGDILIGHMLCVTLKDEPFEGIMSVKLNDGDLTPSMLTMAGEPGNIYMLSMCAGTYPVLLDMLSHFSTEYCAKGPVVVAPTKGIKLFSKRYEFATYKVTKANFLSRISTIELFHKNGKNCTMMSSRAEVI